MLLSVAVSRCQSLSLPLTAFVGHPVIWSEPGKTAAAGQTCRECFCAIVVTGLGQLTDDEQGS
jgi:hypothetical protein